MSQLPLLLSIHDHDDPPQLARFRELLGEELCGILRGCIGHGHLVRMLHLVLLLICLLLRLLLLIWIHAVPCLRARARRARLQQDGRREGGHALPGEKSGMLLTSTLTPSEHHIAATTAAISYHTLPRTNLRMSNPDAKLGEERATVASDDGELLPAAGQPKTKLELAQEQRQWNEDRIRRRLMNEYERAGKALGEVVRRVMLTLLAGFP